MMLDKARRICIDRVINWDLDSEARAVALRENPANGGDQHGPTGERLALVNRKMCLPGRTLGVGFLDGTCFLHQKVKQHANAWAEHANLRFEFSRNEDAEIRISFAADPGSSWSAVGTDCLVERYFPRHLPTMSFGWLTDETPEEELARVIMHEFGHAIGCVHEHQTPAGGVQWNEAAVLAYFSGPPNNWDEATIRFNILDRYSSAQINGSRFDPNSIMLYAFPASLTQNGVATHENDRLSLADIEFIAKMYPGR